MLLERGERGQLAFLRIEASAGRCAGCMRTYFHSAKLYGTTPSRPNRIGDLLSDGLFKNDYQLVTLQVSGLLGRVEEMADLLPKILT